MHQSGPPDKWAVLDTSTTANTKQVADSLAALNRQGFTGPYVVVGNVIYIGGYSQTGEPQ